MVSGKIFGSLNKGGLDMQFLYIICIYSVIHNLRETYSNGANICTLFLLFLKCESFWFCYISVEINPGPWIRVDRFILWILCFLYDLDGWRCPSFLAVMISIECHFFWEETQWWLGVTPSSSLKNHSWRWSGEHMGCWDRNMVGVIQGKCSTLYLPIVLSFWSCRMGHWGRNVTTN